MIIFLLLSIFNKIMLFVTLCIDIWRAQMFNIFTLFRLIGSLLIFLDLSFRVSIMLLYIKFYKLLIKYRTGKWNWNCDDNSVLFELYSAKCEKYSAFLNLSDFLQKLKLDSFDIFFFYLIIEMYNFMRKTYIFYWFK